MRWSSPRQEQSIAYRRKGVRFQITIFALLISLLETSGVSHSRRRDRLFSPLVVSWPRGSAIASRLRLLQETSQEQQEEPTRNRREECSLTKECRTCTTNDKDTIDECQKTGKIKVFTCQVYEDQENQGASKCNKFALQQGFNQLSYLVSDLLNFF